MIVWKSLNILNIKRLNISKSIKISCKVIISLRLMQESYIAVEPQTKNLNVNVCQALFSNCSCATLPKCWNEYWFINLIKLYVDWLWMQFAHSPSFHFYLIGFSKSGFSGWDCSSSERLILPKEQTQREISNRNMSVCLSVHKKSKNLFNKFYVGNDI